MADTKIYPRGYIAMDSGDLIDVTDVKVSTTNNASQVHTLRQKGAGVTLGVEETTVTFNTVVSQEGSEADYFRMVKAGTIKQLRIKIPVETIIVNGVYQMEDLELPLDAPIKQSLTFIGRQED